MNCSINPQMATMVIGIPNILTISTRFPSLKIAAKSMMTINNGPYLLINLITSFHIIFLVKGDTTLTS